jgi:hypothetical protein
MKHVIEAVLTHKALRSSGAIAPLVAASMSVGQPWINAPE